MHFALRRTKNTAREPQSNKRPTKNSVCYIGLCFAQKNAWKLRPWTPIQFASVFSNCIFEPTVLWSQATQHLTRQKQLQTIAQKSCTCLTTISHASMTHCAQHHDIITFIELSCQTNRVSYQSQHSMSSIRRPIRKIHSLFMSLFLCRFSIQNLLFFWNETHTAVASGQYTPIPNKCLLIVAIPFLLLIENSVITLLTNHPNSSC